MTTMKKETKQKFIHIRVAEAEKEEIKAAAEKQGFDSTSSFFMWLFRKFGRSR
jgi:uncharacterized protein (DUF1778 family)